MFANSEEMGYDPNVARHSNGSFTYELTGRFFHTTSTISEYRSNSITGRMTRVWSVDEVESSEENASIKAGSKGPYVLKDVWLEEKAKTEAEIQLSIFEGIDTFWSTPLGPDKAEFEPLKSAHSQLVKSGDYKKYFLDIDIDCTGKTTKTVVGSTRLRGLFATSPTPAPISVNATPRATGDPTHDMDANNLQQSLAREYVPKKQYRVVFKERCEAVQNLGTLGEVFDVVRLTLIRTPSHFTYLHGIY